MSVLHEILLAGAAQGALLCVVILSLPAAAPMAKRLLALFMGMESLHLFFLYLAYSYGLNSPPLPIRILFGLRVLDAPALYLYVRALTEYPFHLDRRCLKHIWVIVPVIGWLFYMQSVPGWLQMSTTDLQYESSTIFWSMYHSLVFAGYAVFALRGLNRHLQRLEQALSSIESLSLRWLRRLVAFVIAADLVHILFDVLRLLHVLGPEPKIVLNLTATLTIIYWLSLGGLRQQTIFTEPVRTALAAVDRTPAPEVETAAEEPPAEAGKYVKSGLQDDRISAIWERLQQLLQNERPHLDPTLDLPKLARQLGVRPQELSQVINSCSGGSFYELINSSRVEAAKALLGSAGSQRRKMLDIALSVGFSSQSTFYNQFKKLTGTTPTVYRDEARTPDSA
jgi:AraC-like DNA-binding protein